MAEEMKVDVVADTTSFRDELILLKDLSASFGAQLTGALKTAAVSGKSLDDVLRRIALNFLKKDTSSKIGIANRRRRAGWDNNYMEKILFATPS